MPMSVDQGVAALVAATQEVQELEARLEVAKANLRTLERETLPPIFDLASCKKFLWRPTGQEAKIGVVTTGSLPKNTEDNPTAREDAIDYAVSIGGEDYVASTVSAAWHRGERQQALEVEAELRRRYNSANVKHAEDIHHMTLKSWVKRRVAAGQPTDMTRLGVDVFTAVKLSRVRGNRHNEDPE